MIYIASCAPFDISDIIVLVYLAEISNGAYEAIYIIVLVYLTEISNGADEAKVHQDNDIYSFICSI
jgi:hypothetical protein